MSKIRKRIKAAVSAALATCILIGSIPVVGAASADGQSAESGLQDLTRYVNLRIGSGGNASNTVIGPQRPNASVNPAPDTEPKNNCTGYRDDGKIRGFSQIHVSGTGVPKYGQFLISPQIGLATRLDGHDSDKANENPTASEYSVTLSRYGIDCAFTPAEHSTIYKFNYPESDNANLLIDLAHNLVNRDAENVQVSVKTDEKGQTVICGSGYYEGGEGPSFDPGGWGEGHSLYFYAVVNKSAKVSGVYDQDGTKPGITELGPVNVTDRSAGMGAYLTFDTQANEEVLLKMGVSFKSVDQAKVWMDDEIPAWDYDAVKDETTRQWNEELNKIVIDGNISDTDKQIFYTAQYHSYLMPRDRTGDFEAYGDADMIDDHFAVWDTWRTLYPLYAITKPELVAKTVNSFVTRMATNGEVRDSFVGGVDMVENQGGDDIDNIIADAYAKGIDGIDWDKAYEVIKKDADDFRLDWQGWSVLNPGDSYYKSLGYIPGDKVSTSTCAYLVEYAYNDYCASQVAKGMGDTENYEKWLNRSGNWLNAWNPNITDNGYSGYIWPKAEDGNWITDSSMPTPSSWQGSWVKYFYEASSWNYSYFVPHDIPQLVEKMGGENTFCDRLWKGIDSGLIDFGNEPAFLTPFLFAYTSKPYLTTDSVARVRERFTLDGVPGNDDSGAMSSWYIFSSMGFFPNAGQDLYYFTSPCYPKTTITLDSGKTLTLIANNLSDENKYIQSITINGEKYNSTMFTHDVITNGGEIVFEMGSSPVDYTKETTAEVKSVTDVENDAVINLDDQNGSEWVHFTDLNGFNRSAGTVDANLAADGISFIGDTKKTGSLSEQTAGISWDNGTPAASYQNCRSYVSSEDGIEFSVKLSGGDANVSIYAAGIKGSAYMEIYDSSGSLLTQANLGSDSNEAYRKISVNIGSKTDEIFNIRILADDQSDDSAVGIAAAVFEPLEACIISFDTMGADKVPNQTVQTGGRITEPQLEERTGFEFLGWYTDESFETKWDFSADTVSGSMTLYAKWSIKQGVYISSIKKQTSSTVVRLASYLDWIHFGSDTVSPIYYDRKAVSESERYLGAPVVLNGEQGENAKNTGQMFAFTWTNGTPTTQSRGTNRYYSYSQSGFELPVTLPAGSYQVELYVTGIGSKAAVEVLDEDGAAAVQSQLWENTGDNRQYKVVTLLINNDEEKTYTVRLTTDKDSAEADNYSLGIAAAAIQLAAGSVTVSASENGSASVQGGAVHLVGDTVTVTAVPDEGYQFAGWEVVSGGADIAYPLRSTLTFTMPTSNVELRANFVKNVASVQSVETVAEQSVITLSDPENMDWAYLGRYSGVVKKADVENSVFPDSVKATSGKLTSENMSSTNANSPYFSWTGGTPVKSSTNYRYIVWSGSGIEFDLSFQPGQYATQLYVSSVRAGAIVQIYNESGEKLYDGKLWNSMGDYRPYYKINLQFDCNKAQTFTIRYLVDTTDTYADWYSVSLYAATVQKTAEHIHEYSDDWKYNGNTHWHECTCGDKADKSAHTLVWKTDKNGGRYQECTVCGYIYKPAQIVGGTPTPKNGTATVNGKTVLYVSGKQVTGTKIVTVSGKMYAVVGGYVKTGKKQVVKIGSKYYIVNASGVVQKGTKNKLIKVGTKSYVVNKNGVVQRKASGKKLVKVGTKSYIVNKLGIVQKGTKNKLVRIGKKAYVVNKKGVVQKNKKKIKVGKKTYKTNKKGVATLKK